MRKTLFCAALLAVVLPLAAHEGHEGHEEHSDLRYLESPELNLVETRSSGVMTGVFNGLHMQLLAAGKDGFYEGWVMRGKERIPISIEWNKDELKADFNGRRFRLESADADKRVYTFSTSSGTARVSFVYETKEGKRMNNPLFLINNNGRNYLMRLRGGCCLRHGSYYAAVLYGLTTLDEARNSEK